MWTEPTGDLLEKCREGESQSLEELLVLLTPLVRHLAGRFSRPGDLHFDDLLQEGYISILRGVHGYDPSRGKFSSFAFSCIRNGMVSFLRRGKAQRSIERLLPPEVEVHYQLPSSKIIDLDLLEGLSVAETTVLDAFLETGSVTSSAKILGWPRKRVDNALQRARRKLRRKLNVESQTGGGSGERG
ncbi:MAG TPA: RNA polymerase subunit sigma [Synergistaceae bacterium]|jgi:RNA polymerase sigma factor (sigma-70 family)|nr:MAG: RNA polymerase, sigma 30 subunit, SigH [Synergistales bacterium 57_84]KUK88878.1 MAG: RNA polymerase, sigma 30 subunit, SigH [Synergistales bacterium 58_81]HBG13749.1 RNA polymerase subunit sigma [Synergistaceae bacterium]HCP07362.1 RNA polymerase subunit sigma [Synergistaceae bacterium]